jgi:hypothetical protein
MRQSKSLMFVGLLGSTIASGSAGLKISVKKVQPLISHSAESSQAGSGLWNTTKNLAQQNGNSLLLFPPFFPHR